MLQILKLITCGQTMQFLNSHLVSFFTIDLVKQPVLTLWTERWQELTHSYICSHTQAHAKKCFNTLNSASILKIIHK